MRGETVVQNLQQLQQKREEILSKIKEIEKDTKGTDKILEALKNQRWYFFKNKKTVLFDKNSGLLWANLNYFPYGEKQEDGSYGSYTYYVNGHIDRKACKEKIEKIIATFDFEGITGFRIPNVYEFWNSLSDRENPFSGIASGNGKGWELKYKRYWFVIKNGSICTKDLDAHL